MYRPFSPFLVPGHPHGSPSLPPVLPPSRLFLNCPPPFRCLFPRCSPVQGSKHVQRKLKARNQGHKVDPNVADQFNQGRLYACISSRPGQCGRCDGYILEGKELEFYVKKMQKKKAKASS
eukprot:364201-Chlamydomonas_euryale.AAC.17